MKSSKLLGVCSLMNCNTLYIKYTKRLFDIVISFLGLIFLSPLFVVTSVLIRFKLGSPVLFTQQRPGKDEEIFTLYKFRTMTNEKDERGNLLADEKRITRFGAFLRSTSIDELPSLYNVLIGNMSIVGPRPLLVKYLPLYNKEQRRRHLVRPGLTGLAQVNGRNSITWDKKFEYDIEYVDRVNLFLDVSIIMNTVIKVLKREGVNSSGSVSMEEFIGTDK